jgi:hypothetical protein
MDISNSGFAAFAGAAAGIGLGGETGGSIHAKHQGPLQWSGAIATAEDCSEIQESLSGPRPTCVLLALQS